MKNKEKGERKKKKRKRGEGFFLLIFGTLLLLIVYLYTNVTFHDTLRGKWPRPARVRKKIISWRGGGGMIDMHNIYP